MTSSNIVITVDGSSSQSIDDLLSESRKFLQTQKSLHSSNSINKSREVIADSTDKDSDSPRSNAPGTASSGSIKRSTSSFQGILNQSGMEHNQDTESGTNSSSRSVGKNSSHDVVTDFKNSQIDSNHSQLGHGNSSKVLSKQSVLSSQSSKPLAQNIQQTPSKKKSSHQSIISTGHSNGNQNHLSAKSKASHISQTIPTFQVSEPNSSSQSVSEKISAYLSNQNIVQQSESFNESRASSLKLNTENKSVSLGSNSICFSAVSAS